MNDITVNSGLYSHDIEAEIITKYEKEILPQKIKQATDKLNEQWKYALSKSNRRKKAVASNNAEWIAWGDKAITKLCGTGNRVADCNDCSAEIQSTCIYYQWQERKKSLEANA